ncbi:MAG: DnaD domain protein [Clostridia bacterium]|nr:DnaD domain protein [Clostridia bacterium]
MKYYETGSGIWGSVFAVPTDVVDKHIKLAGATQLKVLLWLLRNSSRRENITANDIAAALNMNPIDVKDCMEFWYGVGLFKNEDTAKEVQISSERLSEVEFSDDSDEIHKEDNSEKEKKETEYIPYENPKVSTDRGSEIKAAAESYVPPRRTIARAQKPDSVEVAQRIANDDDFAVLIEMTEQLLARPLTNNDSSTLLLMHDSDGLPYEVITMILHFAKSENNLKMRYIEKLGREWGDAGIDTLEKAEEKINSIMQTKEAWNIVCSAFGLNTGVMSAPTSKQTEYAELWINKWGYGKDMLRNAYETCMNNRGEFNLSYINGIIRRWHSDGILTEKDLADSKRERETAQKNGAESPYKNTRTEKSSTPAKTSSSNTSYTIDAFKEYDVFE